MREAIREEILTGEPVGSGSGDTVPALEIAPDRPPAHEGVEEVQYVSRGATIRNVRITEAAGRTAPVLMRTEENTSELQSIMRISYAGFCLKKKTTNLGCR